MDAFEDYHIPEEALEKLRDPQALREYIEEGRTFQEIIGYAPETMEKFYRAGFILFSQKRFREASDVFIFLTTLNPYVHNYWIALGMSEQQNQEYEAALVAYAMASLTDVEDPIPHYHSSTCYMLLNDQDNAWNSLQLTLDAIGDKDQYKEMKEKTLAAKESLSKQRKV